MKISDAVIEADVRRLARGKLSKSSVTSPVVPVAAQEPVDGCTCHSCGLRYHGDLLVPDDVWGKIFPIPVDGFKGGGLLCPTCIMNRIVDAGIWTAARAFDVDLPVVPVAAKAEAEDILRQAEALAIRMGGTLVIDAGRLEIVKPLFSPRDVSGAREWLIRKDGYFYRPNKSGYTTKKHEAGRYEREDAEQEARIEPWHMKAVHQDEWPDDPVSATISKLQAEIARYKAALEEIGKMIGDSWNTPQAKIARAALKGYKGEGEGQ